jgi:hypothetical protein
MPLSSHIVGSKVKGFGPQVFVCQPRHVDERRLDRWRRGVLGEPRYRWPYDSAGGIRPVLKRDSFRALYESFKCGVSSRRFRW